MMCTKTYHTLRFLFLFFRRLIAAMGFAALVLALIGGGKGQPLRSLMNALRADAKPKTGAGYANVAEVGRE